MNYYNGETVLIVEDISTEEDRRRDKEYEMDLKMRYAVQELDKDRFICYCPRNYGRACKKPDKYKSGGCK